MMADYLNRLAGTLEAFLSDIWKSKTQEYGERFLSGPKKRQEDMADREAAFFMCELREAMSEVSRLDL